MSTTKTPPFVWLISGVAALGGFLFGYDLLVISGAKTFYELTFALDSPSTQGWAVSSCIVGCIIGAMSVGGMADRFGRVRLLMLSALLFLVSAIGSGYAPDFTQFVVYRLLGGIGMGMASTLSPMYIAEIAPPRVRGRLVALNQLTIVIGILLAQLVNYSIARYQPIPGDIQRQSALAADVSLYGTGILEERGLLYYNGDVLPMAEGRLNGIPLEAINLPDTGEILSRMDEGLPIISHTDVDAPAFQAISDQQLSQTWVGTTGWRWMFAAEAFPALAFFLLMFLVPASPRWLATHQRHDEALQTLKRIGGDTYAESTLADIRKTLEQNEKKPRIADLLKPGFLKIVVLGVIVAVFQQWCGINVIFNYAPDIFRDAGFTVDAILFNLVIIGLTNMLFTFVGMAAIDRLGRKPLFVTGSAGLLLCHLLIGLCYHTGSTGWYVVGLALLAVAFFAATLGPVAWVYISEIFPNAIRGTAMALAVLSLWVANFVLSFTFPILRDALGPAGTFWTYAAICLVGLVYLSRKAPETKGKALEDIEQTLTRNQIKP